MRTTVIEHREITAVVGPPGGGSRESSCRVGGVRPPSMCTGPGRSRSACPLVPDRTARTSAAMDTAISWGVRASTSSPAGPRTRSISDWGTLPPEQPLGPCLLHGAGSQGADVSRPAGQGGLEGGAGEGVVVGKDQDRVPGRQRLDRCEGRVHVINHGRIPAEMSRDAFKRCGDQPVADNDQARRRPQCFRQGQGSVGQGRDRRRRPRPNSSKTSAPCRVESSPTWSR